jgi:hypothetical protein
MSHIHLVLLTSFVVGSLPHWKVSSVGQQFSVCSVQSYTPSTWTIAGPEQVLDKWILFTE